MNTEFLFKYHVNLGTGLEVGTTPYGQRFIVEVNGGAFEGENFKGTIREHGCADWLTLDNEFGHLDVRATFETHDGAYIYVHYNGLLELTPAIQEAIKTGKGETEFGDQYFITQIRMQTGDPRYYWVNHILCVGEGRERIGRVEYNVYKLVN